MITGYICAALAIMLLLLWPLKRLKNDKLKLLFLKVHKAIGIASIGMIVIHITMTYQVWRQRAFPVLASGIILTLFLVLMLCIYIGRSHIKKKWLQLHHIGALLILIFLILHIVTYFFDLGKYQQNIKSIKISGMEAAGIEDGTYIGDCNAGYIYAKTEVTVKDQRIIKIRLLEHRNERGQRAESVLDRICEEQSTKVDTVTGATNSSKVILKAVENALQKGVKNE